ncbi:MAG TPA: hypothetical protein VHB97_24650 [Polyangia bacterium]|jgi:hypothetical protein|nr:hypothetical protein [Polyangia bacterium]
MAARDTARAASEPKAGEPKAGEPKAGEAGTPSASFFGTSAPAFTRGATRAEPVRATAPVEPVVVPHSTSARASITVGEGADRIALTIAASAHHVRVQAAAASDAMASQLSNNAGSLRDALAGHGLTLAELNTGSAGDSPAREQQSQPQANDGKATTTARGNGDDKESATTTTAPSARRVMA